MLESEQITTPQPRSKLKTLLIHLLLCLLANLACLAPGMCYGFSAVALPEMKKIGPDGLPGISKTEAGWVASIMSIATPIGCLIIGPILDRLGRKMALGLINVPSLTGWLLIAFSPEFWASNPTPIAFVYIGRILNGVSIGMSATPATVYIAEVSEPSLRPSLINATAIAFAIGLLIAYFIGWVLRDDWRLLAMLACIFPILSLTTVWLLPESPSWLAGKGRHVEAEASMMRIHKTNIVNSSTSSGEKFEEPIKKAFFKRETLIPLAIMLGFFLFQQLSGTFVILFYAVDIVQKAGVAIDSYLATVLIGLTRLIVTIIMCFFSTRYGRRPQAMISGSGMTLSMGTLAIYQYLEMTSQPWIPTIAVIFFIVSCTVGFLILPWAMNGEVFPLRIRGITTGITTCCAYVFLFATLNIYPQLEMNLGDYGIFFVYAVLSFVGTVFVALLLPETYGRSLEEVGMLFAKKEKKSKQTRLVKE